MSHISFLFICDTEIRATQLCNRWIGDVVKTVEIYDDYNFEFGRLYKAQTNISSVGCNGEQIIKALWRHNTQNNYDISLLTNFCEDNFAGNKE